MVIDNNFNATGPGNARNNKANGQAGPAGSDRAASGGGKPQDASGGDTVNLSREAQALNSLQAKLQSLPDVDMQRIADIKRAIAEGNFEINAERIAEAMLNQDDLLS